MALAIYAVLSEPKIVENFAIRVADLTPIGPPANLVTLSLLSKTCYNTLRDDCFPVVSAEVFQRSFAMSALRRRLGQLSPSDIAAELPRRFTSLKIIKSGSLDDPGLRDALMRVYFMLLEDDGVNAAQIAWSNLSETLDNILRRSLQKEVNTDKEVTALAIVLFSIVSQSMSDAELDGQAIHDLLAPYAFCSFQCPLSAEIPERYFYPPQKLPTQERGIFFPASHYILYFGHSLRYNTPPVAAYAIQAYLAKYETNPLKVPDKHPFRRTVAELPSLPGVTMTFLEEDNAKSSRLRKRTHSNPSQQYDLIWRRVTSSSDVDRHPPSLCLHHELGALSGSWHGVSLVPDMFFDLSDSIRRLYRLPIQCRLREHYCLNMADMAPVVQGESGYLNAWLPLGCKFLETSEGLTIQEANGQRVAQYRTFDRARKSRTRRASCEPVDIILTGETDAEHSSAWGAFNFYGRVRPSDGFIILVRHPDDSAYNGFGRDVFRGYMLSSQHIVGRRRYAFPEAKASYEMLWNLRSEVE
ncbi:hypothetical protein OE88DRAFT_1664753 [Heliocybe sulcata]|uniref:Uncharacterized protein n=1 Tax=Heliocybe sulcata TaxID=5364 RepID=A0A5C3MWY7_9AGAM|nr:hypothetical protein OE88DRAFT_1664753 [Heliocybe sulcata]